MKDLWGRGIDYLRISLTDKCNLRCIYCMPASGVSFRGHDEVLRIEEILSFVRVAVRCGITKIRLTGGEPLVRRGVVDLIDAISKIDGVKDISMTTNGVLLPDMAAELRKAGLMRVNISLDTLDPEQYRMITRLGDIDKVFKAIDTALAYNFNPVKINAVAVRSLKQDFYAFARLSCARPLHVRFIEYMPVGQSSGATGAGWTRADIIPSTQLRDMISDASLKEGGPALEPILDDSAPGGSGPAIYYRFPHAAGTVGFISAMSNHFCAHCNRLRLTFDGKIRPCLFSDKEIDVRSILRSSADQDEVERRLQDALQQAISIKPREHKPEQTGTVRRMSQIGG